MWWNDVSWSTCVFMKGGLLCNIRIQTLHCCCILIFFKCNPLEMSLNHYKSNPSWSFLIAFLYQVHMIHLPERTGERLRFSLLTAGDTVVKLAESHTLNMKCCEWSQRAICESASIPALLWQPDVLQFRRLSLSCRTEKREYEEKTSKISQRNKDRDWSH